MKTRAAPKSAPAAVATQTKAARKSAGSKKDTTTTQGGYTVTGGQENQNVSVTASSPEQDHIAYRAYCIWQEAGCPEGSHEEHWRQAEQELSRRVPA